MVSTSSESTVWQTPLREALLQTIHSKSIDFFLLSLCLIKSFSPWLDLSIALYTTAQCTTNQMCATIPVQHFFWNISANQQVPLFFGHFNAITGLTNFSILHDLHWFWRTNWSFCLCGFQLKRKQNFTKHYLYRTSHPLIAISFVLCIWKPCWNIIVIVLLS